MLLKLKRYSYSPHETEGVLHVGDRQYATIEQPWTPNPNGAKGGKPFMSCIPDGMYRMTAWTRPSGEQSWIIWNPALGVYRLPEDHEAHQGRDLCLIHSGNWVHDVQGCIAVGTIRSPMFSNVLGYVAQAVKHSQDALQTLRAQLGDGQHILSITNETGASDV